MSRLGLRNYLTYDPPPAGLPEPNTITTYSEESFGIVTLSAGAVFASAIWPVSSLALFFPFVLKRTRTFRTAIWGNGAAVSSTLDVGVYDETGARMFSTGLQSQTGISVAQVFALASAQALKPGRYYLAMVNSDTIGTFVSTSPHLGYLRCYGARQLAAAAPLPASAASWVGIANSYVPLFGVSELATL